MRMAAQFSIGRSVLSFFLVIATSLSVLAQPEDSTQTPPSGGSVTVSGIVSVQPAHSVLPSGSVYLDKGVGGPAPGVAIAIAGAHSRGATVDVEVSTTWPISETQSYRAAISGGLRPIDAKHTDTFVSLLAGYRNRHNTREWVEYKGGATLIFGRSSKYGEPIDSAIKVAGKFAGTGGIDLVKQTKGNREMSLVRGTHTPSADTQTMIRLVSIWASTSFAPALASDGACSG